MTTVAARCHEAEEQGDAEDRTTVSRTGSTGELFGKPATAVGRDVNQETTDDGGCDVGCKEQPESRRDPRGVTLDRNRPAFPQPSTDMQW